MSGVSAKAATKALGGVEHAEPNRVTISEER